MRIRHLNRQQRRGQPIDLIVRTNQARRANAWLDKDAEATDRELDHMAAKVRTLAYDEQAKAHTAPSTAAVVLSSAVSFEQSEGSEETKAGYLVPRRSMTVKAKLTLRDPILEFADDPWRQLDARSKQILATIDAAVMAEHPKFRAQLAAKLYAEHQSKLTYISGTNRRLVWKSDRTLLVPYRPEQLTSIKVKRDGGNHRTFEKEGDALPTWIDADGNLVNPNSTEETEQ